MQKNFYKNNKSLLKLLLVLTLFSYIFFYSPQRNIISGDTSYSNDEFSNVYFPNTSDQEITIITPENQSYTQPMSGYYPAMYSFENDILNSFPSGWIDNDVSTCETKVIGYLDGHNDIVEQYDNQGSAAAQMNKDIPATSIITVEFWVRTDLLVFVYFNIQDSLFTDNTFDLNTLSGFSVDTWHHVRFVINTITDKYDSYLDGALKDNQANLPNPMNDVDQIQFNTSPSQINYHIWWDAIGGNWDPNYNIGDNLNEGLLLSYENNTALDWAGYSLDGNINKTILGNTTIPIPSIGSHNIQVFGNNSLGTIYQSDMRYFSINPIKLITPENKTYFEPMSGYYPATYGFENDKVGSNPNGWNITEPASCSVDVVDNIGGHQSVVHITDSNAAGYPQMSKSISLTSGIVEFWIRAGETNRQHYIQISDDSNDGLHFYMQNTGYWIYYSGGYNNIETYIANQWYHVKIEFDTSNFHLWINGVSKDGGSGFGLAGSPSSFTKITFNTDHGEVGGDIWIDAIGYSWDPSYSLGSNLNEGLLLSYENSTTLDWTGYSLDGLTNKTIVGNTTIPLPFDGTHNIQIYGNDSLSTMYTSNKRYFTINQKIIINTPENITYTEPMNGYYPATYGFENDILNSFPSGWIDNDVSTCETKVIGYLDGHNAVVQQYDNHGSAAAQMNKDIPATSIITVEFWVRTDLLVFVYFNVQDSLLVDNTFDLNTLSGFSVDTWHHVRFEINTITDKYDSYLDGVLKNNQTNLTYPMIDVANIQFNTAPSQINYHIWWDAIGGNWDPNYNVGDNLKEGLLLSFKNYTNLDWMGFSLDGTVNKTIIGNTTIPLPEDGNHNIQVFRNDSLGTIYSSDMRYFSVDTLSPIITINSPLQNEYFGSTAPNFEVSITEPNLNTTWYTLDSELTNITFTGFTGTIDQTEWDDQVDGSIIILFYANDTFGYINYGEVLVEKDTLDPVITINSPLIGESFTDLLPRFNLTINEVNLNTTWYTLDGGATTIDFTELTGYIDSTAWNNAPIGAVTIRFYARDKAGNEVYQDVVVIKSSSQQEPPPGIPGFNVALLCLTIVIIIVSSLKIKKCKVK